MVRPLPRKSLVPVLALLLAAAGCTNSAEDGSTPPTGPPTTTTTTPIAAEVMVESDASTPGPAYELEWTRVFEIPSPYWITSLVTTDAGLFAVGANHEGGFYGESIVWTSDDGANWIELDIGSVLGDDAVVSTVTAVRDGVMALGFVAADGGHEATAWTSPDGLNWTEAELGYFVPQSSTPYMQNLLWYSDAASGPTGAVVAASAHPALEWEAAQSAVIRALPDGFHDIDPDRIMMTPTSVDVVAGSLAVFSASLADLDLPEVLEAQRLTNSSAQPEEPMMFVSSDLASWDRIDGSPQGTDGFVSDIAASKEGFVASVFGRSSEGLYASSDGRVWDLVDAPSGATTLHGLVSDDDRLFGSAWVGEGHYLYSSDDGGATWQQIASGLSEPVWLAAAGPAGVLGTGWEEDAGGWWSPGDQPPMVVEKDGITLSIGPGPDGFRVTSEPDGAVIVSADVGIADPEWGGEWLAPPDALVVAADSQTVRVDDLAGGEPLITVSFAELDDAYETASRDAGSGPNAAPRTLIFFSADAIQWTRQTLAESVGKDGHVMASCVTADAVLMAIEEGSGNDGSARALWLGTPLESSDVLEVGDSVDVPEPVFGGPGLVWSTTRVEGTQPSLSAVAATAFGVFAIGQDRADGIYAPSTLWHSPDGATWANLDAASLLGEGAVVDSLEVGGPGLLALGFLPHEATHRATVWTTSDGEKWNATDLGYVVPISDDPYVVNELRYRAAAAGSQSAVVAVTAREGFAWHELEPRVLDALPDGLGDFQDGLMIDPWKIEVTLGGFTVFSERVADLDVDQGLFAAYERGVSAGPDTDQNLTFVTDDFVQWDRTDAGIADPEPLLGLAATDESFVAATWGWGGPSKLFGSNDGRVWGEFDLPAGADPITAVFALDGAVLVSGHSGSGAALWESRDDGRNWRVLAGLPADMWSVSSGPMGIIGTGEEGNDGWGGPDPEAMTTIEKDGLQLAIASGPGGFALTDSDGNLLVEADLVLAGMEGLGFEPPEALHFNHATQKVTVIDPATSETLFTLSYEELESAYRAAQIEAGAGMPFAPPETLLYFSEDGSKWSKQAVSAAIGLRGFVDENTMTVGDGFVVMALIEEFGGDETEDSLWRGTLP